jgi:hypothetical protein
VNLGVVDANPSSTEGTISIMQHLQTYCPETTEKQPILCSGDGMSVERMIHAQRGRVNGLTKEERVECTPPAAQEFHKEILKLQVT